MYKKNEVDKKGRKTGKRKENTIGSISKMPSLFKKSTSDMGTLSQNHRKVLHRCRMMLLKDLEVTDVLEYMAQEDGLRNDTREMIMNYPTREQRVGILLDKLETHGDRVFLLFMEALREHYKHLHYVLEETLRNIGEKDEKNNDQGLSISGETVRKVIRSNLRKKAEYSQGSESADDLDIVFYDHEEDAYIDCYSIPSRGRLQKERWIKQTSEQEQNSSLEQCEDDEEDTNYMAVVARDLLFKRIDISEIPSEVKHPPKQCKVFVIDNENKYGLIKKERKSDSITPDIAQVSQFGQETSPLKARGAQLDTQISHELPDYTAPPPPSKHRVDMFDGRSSPDAPPPLPPKPGNLPPLGFRPLVKPMPQTPGTKINSQDAEQDDAPKSDQNTEEQEEEDEVKPPPRSTSLIQNSTEDQFDDKPLPSPKVDNIDKTTKKPFKSSQSRSKESSPALSCSGSERSQSPEKSPPLPPRKYMEHSSTSENLAGSGALTSPSVRALSPNPDQNGTSETDAPTIITNVKELPSKNVSSFDAEVKEDGSLAIPLYKTTESVSVNDDKNVNGSATLAVEEEEFDPYSMGVDSIFQVRRARHGIPCVVVEVLVCG